MNNKIDDIYRDLNDFEIQLKQVNQELFRLDENMLKIDSPTIRDFYYLESKKETLKQKLKKKVQKLLKSQQNNSKIFQDVILNSNDYDWELIEYIYLGASLQPNDWEDLIQNALEQIMNNLNSQHKEFDNYNHLLSLTDKIPVKHFGEHSKYLSTLQKQLSSEDSKLVYWVMHILWYQGYGDSKTIEGFKQNLEHSDWRIRVLAWEYLKTWAREFNISGLKNISLSTSDRWRKKIFRNFEAKLMS